MKDFAEFFEATRHRVFRTVVAATGTRSDAEDVVAEAYARAYAEWARVSAHPNPVAWVLRTALNVHRSTWRRLRREVFMTPPERVAVDASTVLDSEVRSAVRALPRRQREVLALRLLADLSAEEVAAVLGIAAATVHVHLHRALRALRERLGSPDVGVTGGAEPPGTTQLDVIEFSMRWEVRHA